MIDGHILGTRLLGMMAGVKRRKHATHNCSKEDAGPTADERCVEHTKEAKTNRDEEERLAEDGPGDQTQGFCRTSDHHSEQTAQQDALSVVWKGRCGASRIGVGLCKSRMARTR